MDKFKIKNLIAETRQYLSTAYQFILFKTPSYTFKLI